jgi:hypothetical protein
VGRFRRNDGRLGRLRRRPLRLGPAGVLLATSAIVVTACGTDHPTSPSAVPGVSSAGNASVSPGGGAATGWNTAPKPAPPSDTQAPTAPSNLHIAQQWDTCAFLFEWTASTDDRSTSSEISYAFLVNGTVDPTYGWWPGNTSWTGGSPSQMWGDCMVYPRTGQYTIQIIARDAAGNISQPSNALSVTVNNVP